MKKKIKSSSSKGIPTQKSFNKLLLAVLIIITAIIYSSSLKNEFTNWDDNRYITENRDIQTLHGDSITYTLKKTFSSYVMGNYHPLAILTYCVEYQRYQLDPYGYHLTNLILHLFNIMLVFGFIWLLTGQQWVTFFTALLFAIHPMHVESVAWVSERKDVIYSFFYLASLCTYVLYLREEKWKSYFYAFAFSLFALAVLSKAMAVSLPLTFFAVDYFLGRKITNRTIMEKAPFAILSFIFGYIAIIAQNVNGSPPDIAHYNILDRILFTCYALVMYLWKLIAPVNLSCLYNYPVKQSSGLLPGLRMYPLVFYLAPGMIVLLGLLIYKSNRFRKDLLFGVLFFLSTIVLVLQILPVGKAIIADRYSYLPFIGIFFIMVRCLTEVWESKPDKFKYLKIPAKVAFALFLIECSYLTVQRCYVWHDSVSLWNDAIHFDPNCALAYNKRGDAYSSLGKAEDAINDFTSAIIIKPDYAEAFYNRGVSNNGLGKYKEAIKDYDSTILLKPENMEAYCNRGGVYQYLGKYNEAIKDYTSAILLNPDPWLTYNNRGIVYGILGQFDNAIKDYTSAIAIKQDYSDAYDNKGTAYANLGKYNDAIKNYDTAIHINPNYREAYNNRGIINYRLGKYNEAIQDFTSAIHIRPDLAATYKDRSNAYFTIKNYRLALDDALRAKQLGYNIDPVLIQMIQSKIVNTAH